MTRLRRSLSDSGPPDEPRNSVPSACGCNTRRAAISRRSGIAERQSPGGFAAHPDRAGVEVDLIPSERDDLLGAQAAQQTSQDQTSVIARRAQQVGNLRIGQFPRQSVGRRQPRGLRCEQGRGGGLSTPSNRQRPPALPLHRGGLRRAGGKNSTSHIARNPSAAAAPRLMPASRA